MNAMDREIMRRAWVGTEDDETSTTALGLVGKPWKNVVITFTGVENKVGHMEVWRAQG